MRSKPDTLPSPRDDETQRSLLEGTVGPHRLVFDLRTLLAIERREGRVEHAAIRGPVDLRAWFGLPSSTDLSGDSVLVPGDEAVYRLVVDELSSLVQSDLQSVYPVPHILHPLTRRLCLRGIVALESGLAFLVDPSALAREAWKATA